MTISIFKKEKTTTGQISSVEAYNVWHSLRDRYGSIETFQIFDNFVHDRELSAVINSRINTYQKQITKLVNVAKQYKILVPSRPPAKMILENPTDEISDKLIHRRIFRDIVFELTAMNRAISTGTTNDNLRQLFYDFLKKNSEIPFTEFLKRILFI